LTLTNGLPNIPDKNINSGVGFIEISGKQNPIAGMEYYPEIPWLRVTGEGFKLPYSGKKREEKRNSDREDAIVCRNQDKKGVL
jgi:hypothetical protein